VPDAVVELLRSAGMGNAAGESTQDHSSSLPFAPLTPPPGFDRATIDLALREMERARRAAGARRRLRLFAGGVAAAAGLALAVWAWPVLVGRGSGAGVDSRSGLAAFDAGKRLDIVDAFRLAAALRERPSGGGAGTTTLLRDGWDLTSDGAVDQRDVDEIARRAVKLSVSSAAASPDANAPVAWTGADAVWVDSMSTDRPERRSGGMARGGAS
jgi:hypothetical protein